jgi:serine/threonine protein kinase
MRLEHPCLPRVYRVFEESKHNRAYVLMDYIEGSNLECLRNQQPGKHLELTQVIDIMTPIVSAISYLHRQNLPIVHRDIKPSNIIVPARSEEAVLVDFGIAKIYEPEATTTAVRHCSPGYGAPEQYGIGTTPRTDVYGLGATLYTLLTGTIPVDALERMIQLNEKEPDPLVPVNQVITTIPASVSEAVARAMSTRSSARFATVEKFWEALTGEVERQPSSEPLFASFYLPEKPASPTGRGQAIAPTIDYDNGTLPQGKAETSHTRKVGVIGAVVVAVLLLVGLGIGIIHQSFTPQHIGSVPTQKQPVNGSATPLSSTTSQASPPLLGQQYIGRISDLVTNTTTSMALTQISQSAGQIRGNFSGLGLTGPFAGTVDTADNIHFQVTIYGGTETLDFEGTIKLGGTLAGSYRVLRNQQFTGESGLWSVSP